MATDDDAQLHELFARMRRAWTEGDARAYGDCFTADVDYVGYDGLHVRGREETAARHDRLFRGVLSGSALVGELVAIRYLRPDVAVVHGTGSVLMPWRSRLPRGRRSYQTMVAVRGPDGWRFAAFHNSRLRPVRIPEPDAFPSRASRALSRLAGKMTPHPKEA
jgi:uncharacterized protein (TIGR02246 family)